MEGVISVMGVLVLLGEVEKRGEEVLALPLKQEEVFDVTHH